MSGMARLPCPEPGHIANRLGFGKYVTRSQVEHTTLLSTRNFPDNIHRGNLAMFRWDAAGAMRDIKSPLLVLLAGDMEIVTNPRQAKQSQMTIHRRFQRHRRRKPHGFLERLTIYDAAIASFAMTAHAGGIRIVPPTSA
jgi:hypothetical protein